MAKSIPGVFTQFKGLYVRGSVDDCPPDHFPDCLNTKYTKAGVETREGTLEYLPEADIVRMALYKPLPPFSGTHTPRIIALKSNGELHDVLLSPSLLHTDVLWKDFGLVNFFGRCYITPSDGRIGIQNESVYVYDGSGSSGFRIAGGAAPTSALTASFNNATPFFTDVGTYLLSYAFETASGFITQPRVPFVGVDATGGGSIQGTVPLGPLGTSARWIIITKSFALDTIGPPGGPWEVARALVTPLFFAQRIDDNITTSYDLGNLFDEGLIVDASYLLAQLETIPAGVGILDYKGRMVVYGSYDDPSLVRVSEIGEPEAFSATSGFIINDPSDSTGVRCATEFQGNLYYFKQSRGYLTQDNTFEASTWIVTNFEKARGTEQYGIGAFLDAKDSSSEGFPIATAGALYFFNGTFAEPELSYKIRDLWLRINQEFFYLTQVSVDPTNKRLYILVALDDSEEISHVIYGDYRDGLNPLNIKWSLWEYEDDITSILSYTDFTGDVPLLVTRIATDHNIFDLDITGAAKDDDGAVIDSYFRLAPVRFGSGISEFQNIHLRGTGPCTLAFSLFGEDDTVSVTPQTLIVPSSAPGREYDQLCNLLSEQGTLKVRCNTLGEAYKINMIILKGRMMYGKRPRS